MYKNLSFLKKSLLWLVVASACCTGFFFGYKQISHATRTPNFGASFDGGIYRPVPQPRIGVTPAPQTPPAQPTPSQAPSTGN